MTSQALIVHTVIVSDGSEKKHRGKYEKARGLSSKSELESGKEPCEAREGGTTSRIQKRGRGARALLNKSILNAASCFLLILHENFRATMRYLGRRFSVPKLCAVPP